MSVSQSPPGAAPRLGRVVLIAAAAALGGFLFGYDTSVINGGVDAIQQHFNVDTFVTGLVVSSALLGSAVGAALAGGAANRFGRIVMQVAAVLFVVSSIGSAVPFAVWELALWRVLGGIAIGIASMIAPGYISEIAPAV